MVLKLINTLKMKKEKCWVFVDKDGTEKISNSEPMRRQFKGKRILSAMWGMCSGNYSKNNWNKWCNGWSTDENDFLPFMGVVIPKGTIEKIMEEKLINKIKELTGVEISFEDSCKIIEMLKVKYEKCEQCNGTGEINQGERSGGGHYIEDCYKCRGNGVIEVEEEDENPFNFAF